MGIDDKIKLMYFPGLKKKNYLYITKDNKIKFKGLPIMKDNSSKLSTLVFDKIIKNNLLNGIVKINTKQLRTILYNELEKDLSTAGLLYRTKKSNLYGDQSCLYAQISNKYGPGKHLLLANNKNIGVGKQKKYCTIKEFKDNGLTLEDINLDKTFSELQIFSENDITDGFYKGNIKNYTEYLNLG